MLYSSLCVMLRASSGENGVGVSSFCVIFRGWNASACGFAGFSGMLGYALGMH